MNASQLFFDQRNLDLLSTSPRQKQSSYTEIPEAPTFEVPLFSSQRCFSDIQASQIYQTVQKPKEKRCFPESSELYYSQKQDLPPSQPSVLDILSTQLYNNIPNTGHAKQSEGNREYLVPRKSKKNLSSSRIVDKDSNPAKGKSTIGDIRTTTEFQNHDQKFDKTTKRKRFISPVTPLVPRGDGPFKQPLQEVSPHQHQSKPSKTPDYRSIKRELKKDNIPTPMPLVLPSSHGIKLRSIEEIPAENYRSIFDYPYFNIVQSRVFDEVFYTDKPLVVCAPTGAGKTVIFELAIVRLIMQLENHAWRNFKVVYMAPIKALCSEKFSDWKDKFEPYHLKCAELTGDTEVDDYYELQEVNIILTTPEKWDSMTRRWRDNSCFVQSVCLFCIDEIHILNDHSRGATIEAVISRMKTIQAAMGRSSVENLLPKLRFVAVSATIPNIKDVAEWLGDNEPAISVKMDDSLRPVRLRKVVLGFYFDEQKGSAFHFDLSLNYKLAGIIHTYSEDKPTLVFCSTRKSTQQAGEVLARDSRGTMIRSTQQRQKLMKYANMVKDNKLRDLVMKGIGFHHAGMDIQDRKYMEELFSTGDLPVLVATSTLAMGVNLPAHLVILKSTQYYNMGCHEEYSDTQILQMIGRAGRPQFDTTATAVIMTKNQTKEKYENLLNGTQVIESSLHKHLVEHLNAEIVLHTINDISIAMEWIRYTFLYIRVMKNPKHYGMPEGLDKVQIEKRLQDLCMKNLNELEVTKMITMDEETFDVKPTEAGRLMARYCIAFETMKKFFSIIGTESQSDLINLLADCEEFAEIQLRTNEKKTLNTLNKDKNRLTIRYPIQGKIKTKQMKIIVLIQAVLGSLTVQDFSLQQDTTRIFRAANRISRCLLELLWMKPEFKSLLSSVQICKSFRARLWEDSKYITKQLDGIGPTLSTALVNAGISSFQKIEETNPRELELIVNRHPPFGNQVRDAVAGLPKYELTIEQVAKYSNSTADLWLHLSLANQEQLQEKKTTSQNHTCVLLIGDEDNKVVYHRKIMDTYLIKDNGLTKKLEIKRADNGPDLSINLISQDWVGLDVQSTYTPFYSGPKKISSSSTGQKNLPVHSRPVQEDKSSSSNQMKENTAIQNRIPCNHSCMNKRLCGHDCCRNGVVPKLKRTSQVTQPPTKEFKRPNSLNSYMSDLKNKMLYFPDKPNVKRLKMSGNMKDIDLNRFAYNPNTPSLTHSAPRTPKQRTSLNIEQKREYAPQNYNSMTNMCGDVPDCYVNDSVTAPKTTEQNSDNECQIIDEWEDMNIQQGFSDDDFIDEMGDAKFYTKWDQENEQSHPKCFSNINKNPSFRSNVGTCIKTSGTNLENSEFVSNPDGKNPEIRQLITGGSKCNMDWSELDMYQKRRETEYNDYDYELPDLDTDNYDNGDNDDPADFQIQSSLLPTQFNNNKQGSKRDISYQHQRYQGGPNKVRMESKPPLTPHRYGQVVAWSNTSQNNSPDWSGSDNDIVTADTESDNTSLLLQRDKESLNRHIEDICSKPWLKKTLKPQQCLARSENTNTKPQQCLARSEDIRSKSQHMSRSEDICSKSQHMSRSEEVYWKPPDKQSHSEYIGLKRPPEPQQYLPKSEDIDSKFAAKDIQIGGKLHNINKWNFQKQGPDNRINKDADKHLTREDNSGRETFNEESLGNSNVLSNNGYTDSSEHMKGDGDCKEDAGCSALKSYNNFFSTNQNTESNENAQDTFNSIFDGIF